MILAFVGLGLAIFALLWAAAAWHWAITQDRRRAQEIAACDAVGVPFSQADIALVYQRAWQTDRLCKWLALSFRVVSYDDDGTERVTWNTPIFPQSYPWGEEMPEAQEMERIFHEVVGPPT